jgi:hypothetical protein
MIEKHQRAVLRSLGSGRERERWESPGAGVVRFSP